MLRNIRLLYLHNILTDFCPHWPFQIIYFATMTGSYTAAMSVIALETLSAALCDIPTGIFSDRMGRRFTMVCGSLSCALGLSCYAWAHGILILYLGAFLWGLGQCLFSGTNNALLFESLKSNNMEKDYPRYRGTAGSMYQIGLGASAFLSIWLSNFGLQITFIAAIIPQIIAVFVGLSFTEPRQHMTMPRKGLSILKQACTKTWNNPHLLALVSARAISYGAGEAMFKSQSALVNILWPSWAVGLYRGFAHIFSFLGFQVAGFLLNRFSEPRVFIVRDLYWLLVDTLALIINSFISPMLFISGAFFFGPGEVASDHLMQKEFTDDERATMGSISSFTTSMALTIVALGIGFVSDHFGLRAGLGLGVLISFFSLPIYLRIFRKNFGF